MSSFWMNMIIGIMMIIGFVGIHEGIHYSISKDYGCTDVSFSANWQGVYTVTDVNTCQTDLTGWYFAQSLNEIASGIMIFLMMIVYVMVIRWQ